MSDTKSKDPVDRQVIGFNHRVEAFTWPQSHWHLQNYAEVLTSKGFWRATRHSMTMGAARTALSVLLGRNGIVSRAIGYEIDIYGFWGLLISNNALCVAPSQAANFAT